MTLSSSRNCPTRYSEMLRLGAERIRRRIGPTLVACIPTGRPLDTVRRIRGPRECESARQTERETAAPAHAGPLARVGFIPVALRSAPRHVGGDEVAL